VALKTLCANIVLEERKAESAEDIAAAERPASAMIEMPFGVR